MIGSETGFLGGLVNSPVIQINSHHLNLSLTTEVNDSLKEDR